MEPKKRNRRKIYRLSNYVKTVKDNDEIIIYNGKTGNIGVLPLRIWNKIRVFPEITLKNEEDIIIDLIKRGIFVEMSDEEEYKSVKTLMEMNFFNFYLLHLIILPTENCNFRCIYCYESFKKGKIKKEVVRGIKNFIYHRIKKLTTFTYLGLVENPF